MKLFGNNDLGTHQGKDGQRCNNEICGRLTEDATIYRDHIVKELCTLCGVKNAFEMLMHSEDTPFQTCTVVRYVIRVELHFKWYTLYYRHTRHTRHLPTLTYGAET
jgi:hypothetical protein